MGLRGASEELEEPRCLVLAVALRGDGTLHALRGDRLQLRAEGVDSGAVAVDSFDGAARSPRAAGSARPAVSAARDPRCVGVLRGAVGLGLRRASEPREREDEPQGGGSLHPVSLAKVVSRGHETFCGRESARACRAAGAARRAAGARRTRTRTGGVEGAVRLRRTGVPRARHVARASRGAGHSGAARRAAAVDCARGAVAEDGPARARRRALEIAGAALAGEVRTCRVCAASHAAVSVARERVAAVRGFADDRDAEAARRDVGVARLVLLAPEVAAPAGRRAREGRYRRRVAAALHPAAMNVARGRSGAVHARDAAPQAAALDPARHAGRARHGGGAGVVGGAREEARAGDARPSRGDARIRRAEACRAPGAAVGAARESAACAARRGAAAGPRVAGRARRELGRDAAGGADREGRGRVREEAARSVHAREGTRSRQRLAAVGAARVRRAAAGRCVGRRVRRALRGASMRRR